MINNDINKTLDSLLTQVNYSKFQSGYIPSNFALQFMNFIKLVNPEENKSPLFHYDMLDTIGKNDNVLIVSFRGSAKTSVCAELMILYLAVYGELPKIGKIHLGMYVGDTMENGVKNLRNNLEFRYENSKFLQKYIPYVKFTDPEWEFKNLNGHELTFKGYGANTGVRGFKKYGIRPQLACHSKGTIITTEYGTHKVEDYKGIILPLRYCTGVKVKVAGLIETEIVTPDHKYLCKPIIKTRKKEYLSNGKTKSTTTISYSQNEWVEAQNLSTKQSLGKQQYLTHYLAKPIDMTVGSIQPILTPKTVITNRNSKGQIINHKTVSELTVYEPMLHKEFWWIYGLWLADGHQTKHVLGFSLSPKKDNGTLEQKAKACGLKVSQFVRQKSGCVQKFIHNTILSTWLRPYHLKPNVKDIPDWVLKLDLDKQKELLLGYIAGDGYIANNQVRINSINLKTLQSLGIIAERLGLPYMIRTTKQEGQLAVFKDYVSITKKQYELRLCVGVTKILGISINEDTDVMRRCFISDNYIYRKIMSIQPTQQKYEFIPINTPSHTYLTTFGLSHNCLDDLMSDKSAESKTITADIENIIYKAVRQALHPTKRKVIWIGTPFNKSDPLYKAAGTKSWVTKCYPICEKFPCTREEFKGAWEDRFNYDTVNSEYKLLKETGKIDAFNQELMLRILSDEDRLVLDEDIIWYSRNNVLYNTKNYNFYITTDFATSETEKSDFSVISVWALDYKGVFHWVDGICKRQDMGKNIDDLFRLVEIYHPLLTAVEVSGQQKGFVSWLKRDMASRNSYFTLATDKRSGEEGIRPNTNKLTRFNVAVPLFKQRKIAFPEELRDSSILLEFIDELTSTTPSGFKSLHDDCCDTVSQLPLLDYVPPIDPSLNKQSTTIQEFDDRCFSNIWYEEESVYNSYIV